MKYVLTPLLSCLTTLVSGLASTPNPFERLRAASTARVPLIIGNLEDDGALFAVGITNLTAVAAEIPGNPVTPEYVRSLYPGLNDSMVITSSLPVELWSAVLTGSGVSNAFRYTSGEFLGAVFADMQKFPGAGAWHSSESIFQVVWSSTFQTAIGNFVKDPYTSPAINWPKYIRGPLTNTLAKLAYGGNVDPNNFVETVQSSSLDGPCDALWNRFLDFTVV
ncbi:hypothetical protein B0H10DRAFT_2168600 [Mycena sp. CBHHK59/15]|nr:hypothetical protein B0H10DRAFT_2168600 [Mycena sp. CBHHK59/15]